MTKDRVMRPAPKPPGPGAPAARHGELRLQSRWSLLGNFAHGNYRGTLNATGGTLTWTGRGGGDPVVRGCTVALVRDAAAHWD